MMTVRRKTVRTRRRMRWTAIELLQYFLLAQGYQGKIVQLPSEVPWRQDPPRPAADSKQREMLVLGRRWFQCRRIFTQAAIQAHKK